MTIEDKIKAIVLPYLNEANLFLVSIKVSASKINSKVTVLIDSDTGVKIDECAEISRKLGHELEEQSIMPNAYHLEVSSPGLETPLKMARQYQKNIGRTLQINLLDGTIKTGVLEQITGDNLENFTLLLSETPMKKPKKGEIISPISIALKQVKEAIIQISFK